MIFYSCCHVVRAFLENQRSRAAWLMTPRIFRSKHLWAWLIVCKSWQHFIWEDECHYSETGHGLGWGANVKCSAPYCPLPCNTGTGAPSTCLFQVNSKHQSQVLFCWSHPFPLLSVEYDLVTSHPMVQFIYFISVFVFRVFSQKPISI